MSPNTAVQRTNNHVETVLDGEIALMHIDSGNIYALRDVSAKVWELLESPKTLAELTARIVNDYEVDSQRCQEDLVLLLNDLAKNDLVTLQP